VEPRGSAAVARNVRVPPAPQSAPAATGGTTVAGAVLNVPVTKISVREQKRPRQPQRWRLPTVSAAQAATGVARNPDARAVLQARPVRGMRTNRVV